MADELYPRLAKHYEGEDGVTVIVDRREHDRRARGDRASGRAGPGDGPQRRVIRDRRRARVAGDTLPLAHVS
jgi:hypothetical protein